MRTHGSTSFVKMSIRQLQELGLADDDLFLASRVDLQKWVAKKFAETFQAALPKVAEKSTPLSSDSSPIFTLESFGDDD